MNNFLFLYRIDLKSTPAGTPDKSVESAEGRDAMTKKWMDWISGIAAQDKLTEQGNRLANTGKVLRPNNVVTNGPYAEIKESIGGYSIVKALSYDDAIELAKGCPILSGGGNVEVREIEVM